MSMQAKTKIRNLAIITLVLVVTAWAIKNHNDNQINSDTVLTKEVSSQLKKNIEKAIQRDGFEIAYQTYTDKFRTGSMVGHATDHFFGEVLYKKYGLTGITKCNYKYSFGCQHEIVFGEMAKNGAKASDDIAKFCQSLTSDSATDACKHALGHTLFEYLGENNLAKILGMCEKYDHGIKPHGCVGGALMQDFFPAIYSPFSNLPTAKNFDEANPYDKCLSIPDKFQAMCVYGLTEWWSYVTNKNYAKMVNLCEGLTSVKLKEQCFSGIGGDISYTSNYDIDKTKAVCTLPKSILDKNHCLAGAAWLFINNQKIPNSKVNIFCTDNKTCLNSVLEYQNQYK